MPAPVAHLQSYAQADGHGLTPLLQYSEMVIHPPMLYLGYTGFSVPFAFAMAALLGRYPGRKMDSHHAPLDDGRLGLSNASAFYSARTGPTPF